MIFLMCVMPIVQLILLTFAADSEVRNVNLAIVDLDHTTYSRQLMEKIRTSDRFILVDFPQSSAMADGMMQEGLVDIIITIPQNFEKDFYKYRSADIQMLVNAINGQQATVGASYLSAIIQSFNQQIRKEAAPRMAVQRKNPRPVIRTESSYWYNERLNYKYFMAPGIIGELVTALVMLLTAMNIVREREIGTIEQINVTPIRKWQFILGKLIPFLLVGLILLTVGLTAGKIIFDIPIQGELWIIVSYCILNLIAVLGMGLFISNLADTQQQAMLMTFFFLIIFILMSGLFTPIESMPQWAQYLTIPNPIAHFVHVMRSVLLKGSSFWDVIYNFRVTAVLAVVFNLFAIWSYRKVS
jgi:ABC-2 type transport system permease protein